MDLLASLGASDLECETNDFLAAFARHNFQALSHAGGLHVLDTGVNILDVFSYDNQIDAAPTIWCRHTGNLAHRTKIAIGLKQLPQSHIGAFLAITNRRLQRTFEGDTGLANRLDCVRSYPRWNTFLENAGPRFAFFPFDGCAGSFDDLLGGRRHLHTDAVAGNEGD